MNPVDEKIIIKKLKAGDNDAYKYLYDYHYVALCKLSYYMLKDKAQAESIVSDVIFHLWEIRENLELIPPLRNLLNYSCTQQMPELSGPQTTRSGNPLFCYGTGRNPTAKYHSGQSTTFGYIIKKGIGSLVDDKI